jgi:predicted amidohydrolase YtcJ
MDEALRGYTADGAKMMGRFDEFGSITVGKKADLVVLSQNLYEIDVDDITKTDVLLTMMDGRITYVEPSILAGPLQHLDVGHYWQGPE